MLNNNDPNELYEGTSWELVAQDRCIQGASDTHTVGTTVESGLPNITGHIALTSGGDFDITQLEFLGDVNPTTIDFDGSLYLSDIFSSAGTPDSIGTYENYHKLNFDASRSNSAYGASEVVQPPSIYMNIWKCIA